MEQICQFQDMHNTLKKWDNSVIHNKKKGGCKKANSHQAQHRAQGGWSCARDSTFIKKTMDLLTMGWGLIAMENWITSVRILGHAYTMTTCHMTRIRLTVIQLYYIHIMKPGMVHSTQQPQARVRNIDCYIQCHIWYWNALWTSQISEAGQRA